MGASHVSGLSIEQTTKRDHLLEILARCGRVAVAFSAGVDSTVVAKAAALACGDRALAVTARSASLASGELEEAETLAREIGITHRVIETEEFADERYRRNAGDRCYYCKSELYTHLEGLAGPLGVDVIVNGANLDDLGDHRPGMVAAREHSVRSPLIEAKLNKEDVRALAKDWALPIWDKPAMPCLSSRIAYGVEVTPERVANIDAAEQFLRQRLGIRELRVRLEQNDLARIEVTPADIARLAEEPVRLALVSAFTRLGFRAVTLDLKGFQSGGFNALLSSDALLTSFQP